MTWRFCLLSVASFVLREFSGFFYCFSKLFVFLQDNRKLKVLKHQIVRGIFDILLKMVDYSKWKDIEVST